jgi:poly-gamma-glutamate synthesis protein (capsule biosynthesis protein)
MKIFAKWLVKDGGDLRSTFLPQIFVFGLLLALDPILLKGAFAQAPTQTTATPIPTSQWNLATKITTPFTLAAIGDFRELQPFAGLDEPGLQSLLQRLRDSDVSFANLEWQIITPGSVGHGVRGYEIPKDILAADLKATGIRMFNLANNHAVWRGVDSMLATNAFLDEKTDIVHAGTGKDLQEARAPRYLTTRKGIVGLVGMMAISENSPVPPVARTGAATYSSGTFIGSPGVDGLHLRTYYIVTSDQLQALRKIRDAVYARRNEVAYPDMTDPMKGIDPTKYLELFGTWYKVGAEPGNLSYAMDPTDLREILHSIRTGTASADFMIATIHTHQTSFAFQEYSLDNTVPDFLVDLAHQAIDNGADAFIAHGSHTIRGIEIYKGKPIFYGLASFALPPTLIPEVVDPSKFSDMSDVVEGVEAMAATPRFGSAMREALLVTCRYEAGRLREVRLYPVDTGQDFSRPFSRVGIPMTPSSKIALQTLEKVQVLSRPFGTTIAIEDNVGVIRIPITK